MKRWLCLLFVPAVLANPVLLTTTKTYADTIVAKVVSEIYDIPLLTVEPEKIPNETLEALKNVNATEVIIIGGPAVVTPKVEEELKELGYNVTRIWGITRYETAALVAEYFWEKSPEAVLITRELANEKANLEQFNLALQAVQLAIEKEIPLLITPPGELTEPVIDALLTLNVSKVYLFSLNPRPPLIAQLKDLNITVELVSRYRPPAYCRKIEKVLIYARNWSEANPLIGLKIENIKCVELIVSNKTLPADKILNKTVFKEKIKRIKEMFRFRKIEQFRYRIRTMLMKEFKELEKYLKLLKPEEKKKILGELNKTEDIKRILNKTKWLIWKERKFVWQIDLNKTYEKLKEEVEELLEKAKEMGIPTIGEERRLNISERLYEEGKIIGAVKMLESVKRSLERKIDVFEMLEIRKKEKEVLDVWKIKRKLLERIFRKVKKLNITCNTDSDCIPCGCRCIPRKLLEMGIVCPMIYCPIECVCEDGKCKAVKLKDRELLRLGLNKTFIEQLRRKLMERFREMHKGEERKAEEMHKIGGNFTGAHAGKIVKAKLLEIQP